MKLEIRITDFNTEGISRISAVVLPLVEKIAREHGITDQHLDRLIIVDAANFGPVIDELVPGEKYTNVNDIMAVAKTMPFIKRQNELCNNIVVRAEVIDALLEISRSGNSPADLDRQMLAYVLLHEFGHCFDNVNRPSSVYERRTLGGIFKVKQYSEYYINIGMQEYAACFFSAEPVTVELLRYQFSSDIKTIRNAWAGVHKRRFTCAGPYELFEIAFAAAGVGGLSLMQAGKIFGWRIGNQMLQKELLDWNQWFNFDAVNIMADLENTLAIEWQKYPRDLAGFQSAFTNAWYQLIEAGGFRFAEGQRGDGIFFNTY